MSWIESALFGILQGLTEFFPVSSSAHLKLFKILFEKETEGHHVLVDLVGHLGTLFAVLIFFRKEIWSLVTTDRKNLRFLLLATLPLIPCYLIFKPLRDLMSAPECLGFCLMATSGILFLGQKWRPRSPFAHSSNRFLKEALMIGTLQSAALIPGISRSASTISCARVLGWHAKDAVRFSFLLSIPTVIGGNCVELAKIYFMGETPPPASLDTCLIAFVTAGLAGLFAIRFAMNILEKGHLKPFAWYCLGLGALTALYLN